jgi:hypothetical protein
MNECTLTLYFSINKKILVLMQYQLDLKKKIGKKKILIFLIIFFLIYGISTWNLPQFLLLYKDPFNLLEQKFQWLQQSPIQFFLGFLLFSWLPGKLAYICTQIIGILYLVISIYWLTNSLKIDRNNLFWTLALSPFFLIIFTWFGKPDLFLIASLFCIIACNRHNNYATPFFLIISVFAHIQITLFYIVFSLALRLITLNRWLIIGLIVSFSLFGWYLQNIGELNGRIDFIIHNLKLITITQVNQPLFSIFSTFGWLWFVVIYYRSSLGKNFFLVSIICFFITITTLDHTRVFVLLSVPALVYIAKNFPVADFINNVKNSVPFWLLIFFQFQKIQGGKITDSAWSWFWLPKLTNYLGL